MVKIGTRHGYCRGTWSWLLPSSRQDHSQGSIIELHVRRRWASESVPDTERNALGLSGCRTRLATPRELSAWTVVPEKGGGVA
jgi:hypothetical protein